jgi:ATP-dependent RNA helicase DDX10/DBP4
LATIEHAEFDKMPISKKTLEGLSESNFVKMTEIQKESLRLSLNDKDILGAAKTGSGKTLCFIIPVCIFCRVFHEL